MAKAPSIQFYPGDVQRDTALNSVSLAAYGLWHRMMWVMFDGVPYGHLSVNGSVIPPVNLSLLLRVPVEQLEPLILELETAGVCSRNEAGVIYSRRMVRDAKRREVNATNGSKGGNPRLSKSVNRRVKAEVIPLTADAESNTVLTQERKERAEVKTLFCNSRFMVIDVVKEALPELVAEGVNLTHYRDAIRNWSDTKDEKRSDRGWLATFRQWTKTDRDKGELKTTKPVSTGWNPRA